MKKTPIILVATERVFILIILFMPKQTQTDNLPKSNDVDQELKKQIGQMIMLGFRGTEISDESQIAKVIKDVQVGGVVLFDYDVPSKSFGRNILNFDQTKKLISDLQKYSAVPLLVAVDAEGGAVNRLGEKYGFLPIASAEKMGKDLTLETTKKGN
jgi:beta-N-acetylhexosaminidase